MRVKSVTLTMTSFFIAGLGLLVAAPASGRVTSAAEISTRTALSGAHLDYHRGTGDLVAVLSHSNSTAGISAASVPSPAFPALWNSDTGEGVGGDRRVAAMAAGGQGFGECAGGAS